MGMTGTCWKREGTQAHMYSRKGAWKFPVEIRGIDPTNVVIGHKYEIDDGKSFIDLGLNSFFEKDLQEHNIPDMRPGPYFRDTPESAPPGAQAPASTPYQAQGVPPNGLMASATGVVKSCLDNGIPVEQALEWGVLWASLWGEVPGKATALLKTPPVAPQQAKDLEEIPF